MTSTKFTVGIDGGRNSSKVLKPPGGGSSDIFGVESSPAAGKASSEKQSYEDSSTRSRVFGIPEKNVQLSTQSLVRNGVQSNIVENGNSVPAKQVKKTYIRRNPITGEEIEISLETENGEDKSNCDNKEVKDEESQNAPAKPVQTSIRVRNPPGGKSSGIF